MKQIYVIATKYSMSYEVFNRWLNKEKTVLTVEDGYAIYHARPFYTETLEEAIERYKDKGWHNASWKLRHIIESSENFDWDICLHHEEYEGSSKSIIPQECRLKNFEERKSLIHLTNFTTSIEFLQGYLSSEDFREWFWDGQKSNHITIDCINNTNNNNKYDTLDLAF